MHAARIEDYSLLADGETAAVLSRDGSIDWLCWPNFASGACFAALLGTKDHGYWKIAPKAEITSCSRSYRLGTLIVETTFATVEGVIMLIDFMPPVDPKRKGPAYSSIVRVVRALRGTVDLKSDLTIRFDYGRTIPWVTCEPGHHGQSDILHAIAGSDTVILRSGATNGVTLPNKGKDLSTVTEFSLPEGETAWFILTYLSAFADAPPPIDVERELQRTESFWKDWSSVNTYRGAYTAIVERSLLTLKALTYARSGGIVAAPTASLPEKIGGERNWDYRFCWLRDTSFTLLVLLGAGYQEEARAWRLWLLRAIAGSPSQIQTMYGINGDRQIPEWNASWLPGYEHSRPVNIGNGAVDQFQLDVFGEVAAALSRMPQAEDDLRIPAGALHARLTDHVCDIWREPDDGIWETRGGRKHFTYSKVSAWAALDRAIKLAEHADIGDYPDVDLPRWRSLRDEIHAEVCERAFSKKLNSFTQSYDSEELDASCLRLVMVGFLPPEDPRMIGTVEAIEKNLTSDGFVLRYRTETGEDGLPAGEGAFLACSFWLVSNLHLIGRKDDAKALFERLIALANDVGLLSEEYDPQAKRMLGNFPQALSHIALVHAAVTIADQWKPQH
ncbi:glycoside hydrolase family 15 protein [Granulicella sibirica]|uniref:glycoside hydrolase family 15 protein n=1 Tax=Granulicella sibirica TaxID=2479048 RepID=UPI001F4F3ACF|nr:glycoside hydrolase family 15 protein [Granulicella sibirica]